MSYSSENIQSVRELIDSRREKAESDAARREGELRAKIPGYAEIEKQLSKTSEKIWGAISGEGDVSPKIEKLKKENLDLQKKRDKLLADNGYDKNYYLPVYFCEKCSDTGFGEDGKMCSCMKKELVLAGLRSSGIGYLIEKQNFDNFDLSYYDGADRENMSNVFSFCRDYADSFGKGAQSLLFIGATGLGKTHVSTSIAGRVIEKGFDVVYETAQNIFFEFEQNRFNRGDKNTGRFLDTDLLIIDDLGAEVTNQFTVACLYNIINTRISAGKATIINTNLNQHEIRERYEDRITSRLFGEFIPLSFTGSDVRAKKI